MASSIDVRALSVARYGSVGLRHAALVKAIERWIARIRAERRIRRGIEELMTLDDRTLSDIGLARGSIAYAVRYGTSSSMTVNEGVRPQRDRTAASSGR
jgi:uncharacterized protein YjiS (DUF1127 family)